MRRSTEQLIGDLAREAAPVRRLAPPLRRAAVWLGAVALAAALAVWRMADLETFAERASHVRLAIELAGTLATGVLGVVAAFHLSLPDRSRRWMLAPLPPLAVWIGSSGYECWRNWITMGAFGWAPGESAMCFAFILGVGAPLALVLFWQLRKSRPIEPAGVVLTGGLGVAGLASFVLQFFHPFDVTFMDLGLHLAAVALLLVASWGLGRRGLA